MQKTSDAAALSALAKRMRRTAIEMITEAKSGHPGGSLSIAEIVVTMFFDVLRHDPANHGFVSVGIEDQLHGRQPICPKFGDLPTVSRAVFARWHFPRAMPSCGPRLSSAA